MSKISEKKAFEAYPICNCYNEQRMMQEDVNLEYRIGYEEGYDQAMQDMIKDSEHLKYLSDEMGYAYACGCMKTMQDFLEKAEKWLAIHMPFGKVSHESAYDCIQEFKNYMQDEE